MKRYKFIFVIFILSLFFISDAVSYSDLVPVKNKNGVYQAEFKLDRGGVVKVNLPSDMALRENVSGSMIYNGNINQFELLIENKLVPISGNNFNFTLPANVSTGVLNVLLRFSNGIDIGSAFFPINVVKLKKFKSESDEKAFDMPVYGSSGVPVDVEGEFDGNYRNTIVTLSGKRLSILAESTTRAVFVTTNDHSGPGVLKLSELGKNAETKFTNLVVVKVEDRVKEPKTTLGYEQKGFEEKEFQEISNKSDLGLPPEELHRGSEKPTAVIAKRTAPKTIGNQDNTLLTENPAIQTKVVSKKDEPKTVVNESINQNKNPDSKTLKKTLNEQSSSKFQPNDRQQKIKKEVAVVKQDLKEKSVVTMEKSSLQKADTDETKEVANVSSKKEKPVVAKADELQEKEIVPIKKEAPKTQPKATEANNISSKQPQKKKEDIKDFSLVKKDLNEQFSSKINTPDEKSKEEIKKTEVAKVKTKKEMAAITPTPKKSVEKKVAKKSEIKEIEKKSKEKFEKPPVKNVEDKKVITAKQNKGTTIAKTNKYQPSVSEYSPLTLTPKNNVKTEEVKKEKTVVSKKKKVKSIDKDSIHTVAPPSGDIKENPKSKTEVSKTLAKNKQEEKIAKQKTSDKKPEKESKDIKSAKLENIEKSALAAKKEKGFKDKEVSEKKVKDVKTAKTQKNINKKKQTVKNDKKDISKKLDKKEKNEKFDKKALHTVVPESKSKETSVAKAKEDISQKIPPAKKGENDFCIQLASFKKLSEVSNFTSKMKSQGYNPNVKQVILPKKGKWNRVRICDFSTRAAAEKFSKGINKKSLNISSPYVTVY